MELPGGSDGFLTVSGSCHPFLSSETFHTPSLGDEEFEIPPIALDPDSALSVSHFHRPDSAVVGGDDPSFASAFVHPPSQALGALSLGGFSQPGGGALLGSTLAMDLRHPIGSQFSNSSPMTIDVPLDDVAAGLLGGSPLSTIDQSELSTQLGLGLGGGAMLRPAPSPQNPLSAAASPTNSLQDDDMDDFRRSVLVESPVSLSASPGVIPLDPSVTDSAPFPAVSSCGSASPAFLRRGGGGGGGGRRKDPREPVKPVSAYALFFRDTQAAIKGQNPHASFGEVSRIVASMWDSLGEEQKQVYKKKNEAAKREYVKVLTAYRASQIPMEVLGSAPSPPSQAPPPPAPTRAASSVPRPARAQQYNPEENTITNICTSNIILDLPVVSTRSRTGATRPAPPAQPPPHAVTKIIIRKTASPSGGVTVTASPAPCSSARQPPPLQQMHGAPRLQQMVHAQAPPPLQTPPPLQAKPRGVTAAPSPLQIKLVLPALRSDSATPVLVTSMGAEPLPPPAGGEEAMEVEVDVAPGPPAPPPGGPNLCARAGCSKPAVQSSDWDQEYCSNECVATHCRDVFMAWCSIRGQKSTSVT